mmetsp:Transcript_30406/g.46574  ORF Transcript_30406/g.46574 Transcript_30406/m.46574 type:complete len:283 (-) Transcript_30406:9-857(-)
MVNIEDPVHLFNSEYVQVLEKQEDLHFHELRGFLYRLNDDIHHDLVHISRGQVSRIDEHGNLEGVILEADDEQVHELLRSYLVLRSLLEGLVVVFLAVHLEHDIDVSGCDEEALAIVEHYSSVDFACNDDLFEVGLVVSSIRRSFHGLLFLEVLLQVYLNCILLEAESYHIVIPGLKQMKRIRVPQLYELQLLHNLRVDDPEVVSEGLVHDHVVDMHAHHFVGSPQPLHPVDIDVLKQQIDLREGLHVLDELPQELNDFRVVVEDAEEQAVEQGHGVLLDVP